MIRQSATVIGDFSGGQDTKTPILSMPLTKSPNMRNFHCAGVSNRLVGRGGFTKLNSSAIPSDELDVAYPPGYQTYDYKHRDTATHTEISQGFKPKTSADVLKVRLWMKKVLAPTGDITLKIRTDTAGVPTAGAGGIVANGTSSVVTAASLATTYGWITFTFAANPTLVAGTQYHFVISSDVAVSATDYVVWGADDYEIIYPDGSMSYWDATTWVTDPSYDAVFEIYITGGILGDDGYALWDFNSKHQLIGVFGTSLYKMDKRTDRTPDGVWDAIEGGGGLDTYTKFLAHFNGAIGDTPTPATTGQVITYVGTAAVHTAIKKFGTASLLLDGNSDYVTIPDSVDWDMGSGAWTFDCWVYSDLTQTNCIFAQKTDNDNFILVNLEANGQLSMQITIGGIANTQQVLTSAAMVTADTLTHVALVCDGANYYWFVNGVKKAGPTAVTKTWTGFTGALQIGYGTNQNGVAIWFKGYIDEPRGSKGKARWTADFTPPTAEYSTSAVSSSTPISSSRHWTFTDWKSGRMLLNTDIGLYTYIGTEGVDGVGAAPLGKFLTVFKNYAIIAGIRGFPNNIRYSALNDYTTWPSANSLTLYTNDGDVITGVRELRGRLYVFKRYSIHRVSYVGSNPTFQVDPIIGIGCPSHYAIKEVDMGGDVGTVLVFPTMDKKLAVFNGYDLEIINDVMTEKTNDLFATADDQPIALADMNYVYSDLFHAQVKKDTNEYILYCVLNSDTKVNYAFVFDYKTGGVYPYDNQPFSASLIAVSTNKAKIAYCAGYSGYAWIQESGDDDDGDAINAYWVSGKIRADSAGLMSKALLLGVKIKEIYSLVAINMGFKFRLDQNVAWTTVQNFAYNRADEYEFGKMVTFDVGTIHNAFQVKITHNSKDPAPTLYGLELYGEPLGINVKDRATA